MEISNSICSSYRRLCRTEARTI